MNPIKVMMMIALLALPFALSACGGGGASSPTEAAKTFFEASAEGDAETALTVMANADIAAAASRMRKQLKDNEELQKELGVTAEEAEKMDDKDLVLKRNAEKSGVDASKLEYKNEKVDGDKGSVDVVVNGNTVTYKCIKEDGSWKLSMRASMEADDDESEEDDSADEEETEE